MFEICSDNKNIHTHIYTFFWKKVKKYPKVSSNLEMRIIEIGLFCWVTLLAKINEYSQFSYNIISVFGGFCNQVSILKTIKEI
jgi:hypothetical protein